MVSNSGPLIFNKNCASSEIDNVNEQLVVTSIESRFKGFYGLVEGIRRQL